MNRWHSVLIRVGIVLLAVGAVTLLGGGAGLWANEQRDRDGFFLAGPVRYTTSAFAVTLPWLEGEDEAVALENMLGDFRIRMASRDATTPLFVGMGPAADVNRYLNDVGHDEITEVEFAPFTVTSIPRPGAGLAQRPAEQTFWLASDTGTGPRTTTWHAGTPGDWIIVIMNADASAGIDADLSIGATLPGIRPLTIGALTAGGALLTVGVAVIILTVAARRSAARAA